MGNDHGNAQTIIIPYVEKQVVSGSLSEVVCDKLSFREARGVSMKTNRRWDAPRGSIKNQPAARCGGVIKEGLLKGYHVKFPLRQSELASTIYLMCSRLCITVSMAAWRKILFPDNKYLTISESSAWKLLRMMEKQDMGEWSSRLVEHAS